MNLLTIGFNIFFIVLYSQWLVFCGFIAALGTIVRKRVESLDSKMVIDATTVCKVLHEKKVLSKKEYDFEAIQVAGIYNKTTFVGYLFIMFPIIFILKRVNWLDVTTIHLVRRWIRVHRYKLSMSNHVSLFDRKIVEACVLVAHCTGAVLLLLKTEANNEVKNNLDRESVEA